jgi:hypothetical protein
MSAIAPFIRLPIGDIGGLCAAAVHGAGRGGYDDFLERHGREVVDYRWSGWVFGTLLAYLDERHGIDLTQSSHDELSKFLTKTRGATHFVLTDDHRRAYFDALDPGKFSQAALRDYYNEFNEADEDELGEAMLDGIRAIRQSLASVDENSVVLFIIG